MNNVEDILAAINRAREMVLENTKVLVVHTDFIKNLIRPERLHPEMKIPPNILFMLDDRCDVDKAIVLESDMKEHMLQMRNDGLITLYTFDQLKRLLEEK